MRVIDQLIHHIVTDGSAGQRLEFVVKLLSALLDGDAAHEVLEVVELQVLIRTEVELLVASQLTFFVGLLDFFNLLLEVGLRCHERAIHIELIGVVMRQLNKNETHQNSLHIDKSKRDKRRLESDTYAYSVILAVIPYFYHYFGSR